MKTIYLVNEKPDGSGRWLGNCGWSQRWGAAWVGHEGAGLRARENGGHVAEFTMGAAKPELAALYGTPVPVYVGEPPPATAEREPDAIIVCDPEDGSPDWDDLLPLPFVDGDRERFDQHHQSGNTRKVYLDTPPGNPVMEDLLETNGRLLAERDAALAEVRLLRETNERLTKHHFAVDEQVGLLRGALGWNGGTIRDAAMEVSRMSKALDESRRDRDKTVSNLLSQKDGLQELLDESRRKLDELAKQEPVAWRFDLSVGDRTVVHVTTDKAVARVHQEQGTEVEPLYAAPKPAAEFGPGNRGPLGPPTDIHGRPFELPFQHPCEPTPDTPDDPDPEPPKPSPRGLEIERRAKEAATAEVAAHRAAGREVHGKKVDAAPKPAEAPVVMDARDLNTCAACNAGPDMIGPVHTCEPAPADTPAMVEADRLIREGWSPVDDCHVRNSIDSRRHILVGEAVVGAMIALRGGK